jgi:hypothetical protein
MKTLHTLKTQDMRGKFAGRIAKPMTTSNNAQAHC